MPQFPLPKRSYRPTPARFDVGRGFRSMLAGCPKEIIGKSGAMIRDGASVNEALDYVTSAANEVNSTLLTFRALDLAIQPSAARGPAALQRCYHDLLHFDEVDMLADVALLKEHPDFGEKCAHHLGLACLHLVEGGYLTLAQTALSKARMLGLEHKDLDRAQQFAEAFDDSTAYAKETAETWFAPRGAYNIRTPAWERAAYL